MTARQNTDGNWTINYNWSQPYPQGMNWQPYIPQEFKGKSAGEIFHALTLEEEMARIEMVDNWVDAMLTYPDAERIMNKLREQGGSDA